MTLKVELVKNDKVIIKLLYLTTVFSNNFKIHTKNDWDFKKGKNFDINFYNGIMTFPIKPNKDNDNIIIEFAGDPMRKIILKDFSLALLEWSSDILFKSVKYFEIPHIKFHNNLWIIY